MDTYLRVRANIHRRLTPTPRIIPVITAASATATATVLSHKGIRPADQRRPPAAVALHALCVHNITCGWFDRT